MNRRKHRDPQDGAGSSNSATILQYITALGAIATPLLVLLLSGIGWSLREAVKQDFHQRGVEIKRRFELEDMLRSDRIETYNKILEPFIILLMTDEAWATDPSSEGRRRDSVALQKLLSLEYRSHGFKLALVGSDPVVRAYGDLMQYSFHLDPARSATPEEAQELIRLLGLLLLEIRRSMGNDVTTLDHWQMLEWFVTDAREYRRRELATAN